MAILMPIGAEIATADLPSPGAQNPSSLVNVRWQEKTVSIFLVDLLERGEPMDMDRA
ncbi:MAG TPA: hypothetical protein VHW09_24520 [Bryobacteraceae bacterium]|nr:hypothetical protein [Bryobacteraceae bacterium]